MITSPVPPAHSSLTMSPSPSLPPPLRPLLAPFLTLCLLLLACPLVASQSQRTITPSPGFFADQPLRTLTTTPQQPNTTFTAFTFAYTYTLPLLLTNATSVTLSVLTPRLGYISTQPPVALPAVNSAGLRGFLFTSSALTAACQKADAADSTQRGLCTVAVTLVTSDSNATAVTYSLYTLNMLAYSTTYTDTLPHNTWKYYVQYVQYNDLSVNFQLSPTTGQLTTAMYISAAQQLFTPGYPAMTANGTATVSVSGQSCLLTAAVPDIPDFYIVGLYGFTTATTPTTPPAASQLLLTSDVNSSSSGSQFSGYAILSLLSLILAAGFIGLVVLRGCCMYRGWNSANRLGGAGYVADSGGAPVVVGVLDPMAFHTTAGQSGVLRTDRGNSGATEAEIAALPTVVYVSHMSGSGSGEGDECDDPRCTICLDEYVGGVSRITTLRCGHTFHTACVGAWLRQRRHCPLCLQLIDKAHDVKQRRNSMPAEVELADIRPSQQVLPSQRATEPASRTMTDDGDGSVVGLERYSSAATEEDADMCAIEIATPQHSSRPPL